MQHLIIPVTEQNRTPEQLSFFSPEPVALSWPIAIADPVPALLASGSPVAIGVSGGKDSSAAAHATLSYLDAQGHTGPRVLIHSDLGSVEWKDSLPTCERLAERLGLELIVVRRAAGGLLERWQTRWRNNVARYVNLECVKLILPWSTPGMRFCTSELKVAVICSDLGKRFPGQTILSVSGIRREESPRRAKAPIVAVQPRLESKTNQTTGYDWHPILDWTKDAVFAYHTLHTLPLHEAYTVYGSSRVSCAFCILGKQADLIAASTCEDNHDIYRELVALEIESTFGFQDRQWLGDIAPHLLTETARHDLQAAKERARLREEIEAQIPSHLLYVKGWPVAVPSWEEAKLLSKVRRAVATVVGLEVLYTEPEAVRGRYDELIAQKKH